MSVHEVFSNSQNDLSVSSGNRPNPAQRPSALFCASTGDTMTNRGASGAMTQDQSFLGHSITSRSPDTSVWFLDLLTNDMYFRPQTPLGKQWSRDFLTACLSHVLFGVKKTGRTGADSTTGAWSNTPVDTLGMTAYYLGAKKSFTVSGSLISVCWLADYHSGSQGVFEVSIDGTIVDTFNNYIPFGNTRNGLRYGHAARLYQVPDGVHTVEVKCVSNATAAYISYVAGSGDQTSFPKCFVGTGAQASSVSTSHSSDCRQMVIDLVTIFSNSGLPVKAVDTWTAISTTSHMMPDGVHWNSVGCQVVADLMEEASAEPKRLEWPMASGGFFFVQLDASGEVTDYGTFT